MKNMASIAADQAKEYGKLNLQHGQMYYMGHSSSPERVFVNSVSFGKVYFFEYPFKTERFMDERIFRNMVVTGTKTWLKSAYANMFPDTAKALQAQLNGEQGKIHDIASFQPVYVLVRCINPATCLVSDPWAQFEALFPYSVSGSITEDDCSETLEVACTRGEVAALRETLTGSAFQVTGIRER